MKKSRFFSNFFVKVFLISFLLISSFSVVMATREYRYKVMVQECIQCGTCIEIAPELFGIIELCGVEMVATLKLNLPDDEDRILVKEAQDQCPTGAIWTDF